MKIRQLVMVARDLDATVSQLCRLFDLSVCYNDPGVGVFGLVNALLPVGDTFLEVVSPMPGRDDTAAGRLMHRRGGDAGYMVILQTNDYAGARERAEQLRIRRVWDVNRDEVDAMHLHPADLGNTCILSLDDMRPPESWIWAGERWREHVRTELVQALAEVELQCADPAATAQKWAQLLGLQQVSDGWCLELANRTRIRFCAVQSERGAGLAAMGVRCADPDAVRERARSLQLPLIDDAAVMLGGVRFDLLDAA